LFSLTPLQCSERPRHSKTLISAALQALRIQTLRRVVKVQRRYGLVVQDSIATHGSWVFYTTSMAAGFRHMQIVGCSLCRVERLI
jgi:hypothetical protein